MPATVIGSFYDRGTAVNAIHNVPLVEAGGSTLLSPANQSFMNSHGYGSNPLLDSLGGLVEQFLAFERRERGTASKYEMP